MADLFNWLQKRSRWWDVAIVVAVIGVLVARILPNFRRAGTPAYHSCLVNLKMIDGAKEQWAVEQRVLENRDVSGATPTEADLYGADLYLKVAPICLMSGTYSINPIGQNPRCSIPEHALFYGAFEVSDQAGRSIHEVRIRVSRGWRRKSGKTDKSGELELLSRREGNRFEGGKVRVSHPEYQSTDVAFPTNWPTRITLKPKSKK